MIKFENLKLVLWDFDDTLCIHEYHGWNINSEHLYNIDVLLKDKEAWNTGKPNIFMKKFMELCKKNSIRQGLISATNSYKHAVGKNNWVKDKYGIELENFCVSSFEEKLKMMFTISEAYGYNADEILIVDDFWENLERAANNGFQACTPMEIVNYILEYYPNID